MKPSLPARTRRECLQGALCSIAGASALPLSQARADGRLAELSLPALDGRMRSLALPTARVTLLDFWASWCVPCRLSFPWMNDLHDRHATRGLAIVAVNVDRERRDADRFLAQVPARFDVRLDPEGRVASHFAIRGMPSSLIFDHEGRLRHTHSGFKLSDGPVLAAQIEQLLNTYRP